MQQAIILVFLLFSTSFSYGVDQPATESEPIPRFINIHGKHYSDLNAESPRILQSEEYIHDSLNTISNRHVMYYTIIVPVAFVSKDGSTHRQYTFAFRQKSTVEDFHENHAEAMEDIKEVIAELQEDVRNGDLNHIHTRTEELETGHLLIHIVDIVRYWSAWFR